MKVCPKCGRKYEDDKNFCIYCGVKLVKYSKDKAPPKSLSKIGAEAHDILKKKVSIGNKKAEKEKTTISNTKKTSDGDKKLDEIKSDIKEMKRDISSLKFNKDQLSKDIQELLQKTSEFFSEQEKKIKESENKIKHELNEKIDANTESIAKIAERVTDMKHETSDPDEMKKILNILKREIKANREKLLEILKDEITKNWEKKIEEIDKKIKNLEKMKENAIDNKGGKTNNLEKELSKIREEFRKFQIQRNMAVNEKINLNTEAIERLSDKVMKIYESKSTGIGSIIKGGIGKNSSNCQKEIKEIKNEIYNLKKEIKYMEDTILEKLQAKITEGLVE